MSTCHSRGYLLQATGAARQCNGKDCQSCGSGGCASGFI